MSINATSTHTLTPADKEAIIAAGSLNWTIDNDVSFDGYTCPCCGRSASWIVHGGPDRVVLGTGYTPEWAMEDARNAIECDDNIRLLSTTAESDIPATHTYWSN